MEQLGYVYNRSAANLRQQASHTVAMVVPDLRNPFYAALAVEVERYIENEEFVLFISSTGESPAKQRHAIESMIEYGVDGIILSPAASTQPDDLSDLVSGHTPVVLTTRWTAGVSADYVGYDNEKGAERAVAHLLSQGHRRIAFMAGQTESSAGQERLSGYLRAHEEAGVPVDQALIYSHPITTEAARTGIQTLLERNEPPTAVFCFNDFVAHGVLFGLWEAAVVPGRDVAVVGFDNLDEAAHWRPPLTTIDYRRDVLGPAAARLLMERLENPELPVRTVLYEPTLVVRESCGSGQSAQVRGKTGVMPPSEA
jgi:LacI family transcriptional regulator